MSWVTMKKVRTGAGYGPERQVGKGTCTPGTLQSAAPSR